MLVIGVAGHELTAQERDWLQHEGCAGVILFTRNFASQAQVSELTQSIREAASQSPPSTRTTSKSLPATHSRPPTAGSLPIRTTSA